MSLSELMIDIPAEHEANVFGQFDAYAKKLERTFHVTLIARDGSTKIVGESAAAEKVLRSWWNCQKEEIRSRSRTWITRSLLSLTTRKRGS